MTRIRIVIKSIYSKYFRFKYRKDAIIGRNCTFGLKARIINKTGRKDAIHIGNNVMLHGSIICEATGEIKIDDYVSIRRNTYIGSIESVKIGKYTIISDNVHIVDNNNHPISPTERKKMVLSGWSNKEWQWENSISKPIHIHSNVWICQSSRVMKGCHIGDNSILGANSVLTNSVGSNIIAAGNPAKVVKKINEN
ncbi:hypothetical protein AB4237_15420 [Vibrio sp. 10N.261.55.F6]|uniref:acyltransferase n=1 Tax=Vibrio sp. 10N.261.55.F6 TaxID=3229693 RepID=UPI00354BE110